MKKRTPRATTKHLYLNDESLDEVASVVAGSLLEGGVCIIPTDTIYGIVALDDFDDAVQRIYRIKKRPYDKPFIRLIGSIECLKRYTEQKIPPSLKKYWPGPITIVFRGVAGGTVAIRVPDSPFLNRLFKYLDGKGIVAPSANLSGEENISDCNALINTFSGLVDIIVCLDEAHLSGKPSTIIDISGDRWKIIRKGAIDITL
ncbi:MAG: L-threonylcarbamoyladenylate synthase [Spirochaetota bacterium]